MVNEDAFGSGLEQCMIVWLHAWLRNKTSFTERIIKRCSVGLTYLLRGAESFSRIYAVFSYSRKSPHFTERECSLPHSQVPVTCHYPEPARSSSYSPHPTSWRSILILSSHLRLGLPGGLFTSGFPTITLYTLLLSPIRAVRQAWLLRLGD